jgi:hypothetical protein
MESFRNAGQSLPKPPNFGTLRDIGLQRGLMPDERTNSENGPKNKRSRAAGNSPRAKKEGGRK